MHIVEFDDKVNVSKVVRDGVVVANGEEREVVDFNQSNNKKWSYKSWICPHGKVLKNLSFETLRGLINKSNNKGECVICDKHCKL